jgi:hypothetical protein
MLVIKAEKFVQHTLMWKNLSSFGKCARGVLRKTDTSSRKSGQNLLLVQIFVNLLRNSWFSRFESESVMLCDIHNSRLICLYIFIHSSMALQPFVRFWPLLQSRNHFFTDRRTPWTRGQLVARPLPKHRINAHRHPWLELDSNPRFQRSRNRRQFMSQAPRPLWTAICLCT